MCFVLGNTHAWKQEVTHHRNKPVVSLVFHGFSCLLRGHHHTAQCKSSSIQLLLLGICREKKGSKTMSNTNQKTESSTSNTIKPSRMNRCTCSRFATQLCTNSTFVPWVWLTIGVTSQHIGFRNTPQMNNQTKEDLSSDNTWNNHIDQHNNPMILTYSGEGVRFFLHPFSLGPWLDWCTQSTGTKPNGSDIRYAPEQTFRGCSRQEANQLHMQASANAEEEHMRQLNG